MNLKKILLSLATCFSLFLTGCSAENAPVSTENTALSSGFSEESEHSGKEPETSQAEASQISASQPEASQIGASQPEASAEPDNVPAIQPPSQELLDSIAGLSPVGEGYGAGEQLDSNHISTLITGTYEPKYGQYATFRGPADSKTIYLTFDLGWENSTPEGIPYTSLFLDIMKRKNVKASFFITHEYAQTQPDVVRQIIADGNNLGSHGYYHPEDGLPSMSLEEQINDTLNMQNYIKDTFNYDTVEYRFGSGIFSPQSLALISGMGYHTYFWSVNYTDWIIDKQPDPTEAMNYLMSHLHPGAIYMLHSVSSTNLQIFEQFIDAVRAQGYEIELLD